MKLCFQRSWLSFSCSSDERNLACLTNVQSIDALCRVHWTVESVKWRSFTSHFWIRTDLDPSHEQNGQLLSAFVQLRCALFFVFNFLPISSISTHNGLPDLQNGQILSRYECPCNSASQTPDDLFMGSMTRKPMTRPIWVNESKVTGNSKNNNSVSLTFLNLVQHLWSCRACHIGHTTDSLSELDWIVAALSVRYAFGPASSRSPSSHDSILLAFAERQIDCITIQRKESFWARMVLCHSYCLDLCRIGIIPWVRIRCSFPGCKFLIDGTSMLVKSQGRNWLYFRTRDESRIMWVISWLDLGYRSTKRCVREFDRRSAPKLDVHSFFSPVGFPIIDVMPQDIRFIAQYFITHVLTQLHQHWMLLSQDAVRETWICFDNSHCHAASSVIDEMNKLRCRRVAHPPYSPDVTICAFCLFSRRENNLACFHTDEEPELLREVHGMLTAICWDLSKLFEELSWASSLNPWLPTFWSEEDDRQLFIAGQIQAALR
jgi:hypothetical protein